MVEVDGQGNSLIVLNAWISLEERKRTKTRSFSTVRKLDTAGRELWSSELPFTEDNANAVDLAADSRGNVFVLGARPWLARLARDGEVTSAPVTLEGMDIAHNLAVHEDGGLVVTGKVVGEQPRYPTDAVVAMFDRDGAVSWMRTLDRGPHDDPVCLAIGPEGEIIVGGESSEPAEVWLHKYDSAGNELWTSPVTVAMPSAGGLADIGVFDDGSVIVVGGSGECGSAYGPCVAWVNIYESDGTARWSRPFSIEAEAPTPKRSPPDHPRYAAADSVAIVDGSTAVVIGVRNEDLWQQTFANVAGRKPTCPEQRDCDEPRIYQHSDLIPVHRRIRVDPEGRAILVGDATVSEVEHYGFSPAGSLWIAKTRDPATDLRDLR